MSIRNLHNDHLMGVFGYSPFIIQHTAVRSAFLRKNEPRYAHSTLRKIDFQDGVQYKNNASQNLLLL